MTQPLYTISRWNEIYENNRSRILKDLKWVAVPNGHDGENYCRIMAGKDGAVIFSAWILILQVASRCTPRGVLVRANGEPHNPESLSIKTRAPAVWFTKALPVLVSLGWLFHNPLIENDTASTCRESAVKVPDTRQRIEGNGMEGIEGTMPSAEPSGGKGVLELRLESLFNRRPSTPWGVNEIKAWKRAKTVAESLLPDDWQALEQFYAFKETAQAKTYRRMDLSTVLNNLASEVAKAHRFLANPNTTHGPDQRSNSRAYSQTADYSKIPPKRLASTV